MEKKGVIIARKVAHGRDLSVDLDKAFLVASFAVANPDKLSTKYVRDIGLNSALSDMVLRRYGRHPPKTLRPEKVKLEIAGSKVVVDTVAKTLYVRALRLLLRCEFPPDFGKVRSVLFDSEFAYINLELKPKQKLNVSEWIGVDLNIIGGLIVAWIPTTGKVIRLGREYHDMMKTYDELQDSARRGRKNAALNRLTTRRRRRLNDLLHKISAEIVRIALRSGCGIRMEQLKGIREKGITEKPMRIMVQSWPFYKLQTYIKYKCERYGVPVQLVWTRDTSVRCAMHNLVGRREGRLLVCPVGHTVDVDLNAARNISIAQPRYEF